MFCVDIHFCFCGLLM
jgi:hypothetical protein